MVQDVLTLNHLNGERKRKVMKYILFGIPLILFQKSCSGDEHGSHQLPTEHRSAGSPQISMMHHCVNRMEASIRSDLRSGVKYVGHASLLARVSH